MKAAILVRRAVKSPSPAMDFAVEARSGAGFHCAGGEPVYQLPEAGPESVALRERILAKWTVMRPASAPCGGSGTFSRSMPSMFCCSSGTGWRGFSGLEGGGGPDGLLMPAGGQVDFVDGVQSGDEF